MPAQPAPSSILIVGSGVFGLSTAYALTQDAYYNDTNVTVLDRSTFPGPDGSSIDSSRIVRADYADLSYAELALEAQGLWRNSWWGKDVYHEDGLMICVKHMREESDAPRANGYDHGAVPNLTGSEYMRRSLVNVKRLGLREPEDIQALPDSGAIRERLPDIDQSSEHDATRSSDADAAYINLRSGWVDATGAMSLLRARLASTSRVTFATGTVSSLHFNPLDLSDRAGSKPRVLGVNLTSSNQPLTADLTILATGAWTPALLDLRGIASATGQVLAYIRLTPSEQASLAKNPTVLNESTGLFIITPHGNELKVARHGYGYANPTCVPHPEPLFAKAQGRDEDEQTIEVSLPWTGSRDDGASVSTAATVTGMAMGSTPIPDEAVTTLRAFLARTYPSLQNRPFERTRLCWYTDTPVGDWLIDHHPRYHGLFVATGGSGHAFKFAPVVGDCIVKRIKGERVGKGLDAKWDWPSQRREDDHVWTEDWRGGRKGMILKDEFGTAR